MFSIKKALCVAALAVAMTVPAHAVILDGRLTASDQYDWVFDVPATTDGANPITVESQLYVKSTADRFFMFYSVPLSLTDMTWSTKGNSSTCCTHDSWPKNQTYKSTIHSEFFSFNMNGVPVGMAQGRSGNGELTGSAIFAAGKTTAEWLVANDPDEFYTGSTSLDDSKASPILKKDASGKDLYEIEPGQLGAPETYWVFEMGYEFELIRSELVYDPESAASILGLLSGFEYHLSPYKNSDATALATPCLQSNDCAATNLRTSAVPLPAAGWLLLAGVGALGAIRRRAR
jgi:hypothetical protein